MWPVLIRKTAERLLGFKGNDGGFMKVSIFDPLTDADENYANSLEWTNGIKSMEVTFTVTGTGVLSAEAEPEEDKPEDSAPVDEKQEETPAEEVYYVRIKCANASEAKRLAELLGTATAN